LVCVGVQDIYEQNTMKGAKRRQYGGVLGTRTLPFLRWNNHIFHHDIIKIQHHGVEAHVHKKPMSQITPQ
jgi:hypothetical protein